MAVYSVSGLFLVAWAGWRDRRRDAMSRERTVWGAMRRQLSLRNDEDEMNKKVRPSVGGAVVGSRDGDGTWASRPGQQ